jgi:CRP/FNR family transcriptional regulator, cyclic AMP receptor protein
LAIALAPTEVPQGPWDPHGAVDDDDVIAVVVARGMLVHEVRLGGITSSQLLGPGDLAPAGLAGGDETLPAEVTWIAAADTSVTVIPASRATQLPTWPEVAARLVRHAAEQARRASLQQAIGHLPRVEERVLALLWLLAERWGRVGADGVMVPVSLTHEMIGRLVGAQRPTVSLALKELATQGEVTRRADGTWIVRPESAARLGDLAQPPAPPTALPALLPHDQPQARADAPPLRPVLQEKEERLRTDLAALDLRVTRLTVDLRRAAGMHEATIARCRQTRDDVRRARNERLASRTGRG